MKDAFVFLAATVFGFLMCAASLKARFIAIDRASALAQTALARCEHLAGRGLATGQRPRLAAPVASADGMSVQEVLGAAKAQVTSGAGTVAVRPP